MPIRWGGNGSSDWGKAWPPGAGRTWSWPCWVSSSWSERRFVGPWCPCDSRYGQKNTSTANIVYALHTFRPLFSVCRRTLFPSGTRRPVTRRPLPVSETPCAESSTFLPTPSWSTRLIQTALSMYVSPILYFSQFFSIFICDCLNLKWPAV